MDKPLIPQHLMDYIESLVPPRPAEMQAMEARAAEMDFPIIGPSCGHLCYLLARLMAARRIFELGSGFGYSTAWLAQAVQENGGGEVHHVVWDEALSQQARLHLRALGLEAVVRFRIGEAVEILRHTDGLFDLVFNDIEKQDYPGALPVIQQKLRPGGLLIVDNMLWGGRIFDPGDLDASTQGIRSLTKLLTDSPGWVASLNPLRDGLIVAYKK